MKYKLFRISSLILSSGLVILFGNDAFAAHNTSDSVQVSIVGSIISNPCNVSVPNNVFLGSYSQSDLHIAGGNTASIPFNISLTNCPASVSKVTISFSGQPYPDSNYASAIYANTAVVNAADDLGLQLFNADGKTLVNLANGTSYDVDIDSSTHAAKLPMISRMYTPHGEVTSGNFASVVTLNFAWQ
ncbi:TPA: fimbrial protein [Citrobacter werkmanii]